MTRNSDGADYDYGPYEDEYRGFDRAGEDAGRGPVILFLALGVLIIFAGVVWNTYRQGVRPAGAAIPVVDASEQPYKRVAEANPQDQVPDTDKGYYNLLEGKTEEGSVERASIKSRAPLRRDTETLAGAPEVEIPAPPQVEQTEDRVLTANVVTGLDPREESGAAEGVKTASLEAAGPMRLTAPAEQARSVATPLPEPIQPAAVSRFASNGSFQIQLAALRSDAAAQDAWRRVKQRHPRLFNGAVLDVQRADLEARGVFYRLRVGTFETRDTAKAFCTEYKAAGGDCIVVSVKQ